MGGGDAGVVPEEACAAPPSQGVAFRVLEMAKSNLGVDAGKKNNTIGVTVVGRRTTEPAQQSR